MGNKSELQALKTLLDELANRDFKKIKEFCLNERNIAGEKEDIILDRLSNSLVKDAVIIRAFNLGKGNHIFSVAGKDNGYNSNFILKEVNGFYRYAFTASAPLYHLLATFNRLEYKLGEAIKKETSIQFSNEIPLLFEGSEAAKICFDCSYVDVTVPLKECTSLDQNDYEEELQFVGGILRDLYNSKNLNKVFEKVDPISRKILESEIKNRAEKNSLKEYLEYEFSPKHVRFVSECKDLIYIFYQVGDLALEKIEPKFGYYVVLKKDQDLKLVNYRRIQGLDQVLKSEEFEFPMADLLLNRKE